MKKNRFFHTALVLVLSLVLFYLPTILFQVENSEEIWDWDFLGIIMATVYSLTFLLNFFILVPLLLRRKGTITLFFGVNLFLVLLTMFAIPFWIESSVCPTYSGYRMEQNMSLFKLLMHYAGFSLRDGIMVVFSAALGYAIRMGREKEYLEYQELQLQAEKRRVELQSLKVQLNPHFFFNSLNNIYALIGIAPDRARDALHSLSRMMRFLIYESSHPVELSKEGRFIEEYVELMKLRMPAVCSVKCEVSDKLPAELKVMPLLYVTLVENAFKHSSDNGAGFFIHIKMYFTETSRDERKENELVFRVENSYSDGEGNRNSIDSQTGVGLTNVKRQLNLLYPKDFLFEIKKGSGRYSATIAIKEKALKRESETHDGAKTEMYNN